MPAPYPPRVSLLHRRRAFLCPFYHRGTKPEQQAFCPSMTLYFFHLDGQGFPSAMKKGTNLQPMAEAIRAGRLAARTGAERTASELAGWVLRVTDEGGLEVGVFSISDFTAA